MLARTRRDEIAKRMTPAQIAEAQGLARMWWFARERTAGGAAKKGSGFSDIERKEMDRLMKTR